MTPGLVERVGEALCGEPFNDRDPEEQADIRREAARIIAIVTEAHVGVLKANADERRKAMLDCCYGCARLLDEQGRG